MLFLLNLPLDSPPTSQSTLLNLALTSEASLVLVVSVAFSVELLVLEVSYLVVDAWVPAVSELDSTALFLVTLIFSLVVVVCTQLDGLSCHPLSEDLTLLLTLRYLDWPIAIDLALLHPFAFALLSTFYFLQASTMTLLKAEKADQVSTMIYLYCDLSVAHRMSSEPILALHDDHVADPNAVVQFSPNLAFHHVLDDGHHSVPCDDLVHHRDFVACLCHHHPWL